MVSFTATFGVGVRRLVSFEKPLDVKPILVELAAAVTARVKDNRLKWGKDGSVRIIINEVIPSKGLAKQTIAGQRKRFRGPYGATPTSRLERAWGQRL